MAIDMNGITPGQPGGSRSRTVDTQNASQKNDTSKPDKQEIGVEKRGENVSFSGKAKDFQQIEAGLKDHTGVDADKVAKLRASIENGTYEVSPEKVAQKMLDMEKDIF